MYRINTSADGGNRQILPRDFSFLSEADGQIVQAFGDFLMNMMDLHPENGDALILSGCKWELFDMGNQVEELLISPGTIYCHDQNGQGIIVDMDKYIIVQGHRREQGRPILNPFNGTTPPNISSLFDFEHIYISTAISEVAPSPVYSSSNAQDVHVHERIVGGWEYLNGGAPSSSIWNNIYTYQGSGITTLKQQYVDMMTGIYGSPLWMDLVLLAN